MSPRAPLRPCATPGCRRLVPRGHCQPHARTLDRSRGTANQRGYTRQWSQARTRYLAKFPLCAACFARGRTVAATVVDHIIPHRGDQALFWDAANWRSLCALCHGQRTQQETRPNSGRA